MSEYLAELGEEREKTVVRRIFLPFHLQTIMGYIGSYNLGFILLLELRKGRLTNSIDDKSDNSGDIDVIIARITFDQEPTWPPHIDQFTALEVKCAYWSRVESKLKSTKSSYKKQLEIQQQVEDLVGMGFHQVGLLDVIANQVFTGDWVESGFSASESLLKAQEEYLHGRLNEKSQAGHIACSIGAIEGKTEQLGGATASFSLKNFETISQKEPLSEQKQHIRDNLYRIISNLPKHKGPSLAYVDCRMCNKINRIVAMYAPQNDKGESLITGYGCEICGK